MEFAERTGLVHFGFVDQNEDEHKLVRGATVSTHHTDSHYSVGTYEVYNIAFVERTDYLRVAGKRTKQLHRWHIIQIDLTTMLDLPHVFIGLETHSDAFYRQLFHKYRTLSEQSLGVFGKQTANFLTKYNVYAAPTDALEVERILTPEVTSLIASHFGSVAIEIADQALYLYSEHKSITPEILVTMLENGIWLATQIDALESV